MRASIRATSHRSGTGKAAAGLAASYSTALAGVDLTTHFNGSAD